MIASLGREARTTNGSSTITPNFNGFRDERDESFAWLNKTGIAKQQFYLVCADRHWQCHALH
ncbi:MAG: hypothetical protein HQ518_25100 [Rhodopirellula sp.]|nr:hypothetical protein [Rhodopirellula sp.]